MIELDKLHEDVWSDEDNWHVIARETEETYHSAGFYVRDEDGENGPYPTLTLALNQAQALWGEVTLAPANRLRANIDGGRGNEVGDFLLEYLATYGTVGVDAQALAQRVFARIEETD